MRNSVATEQAAVSFKVPRARHLELVHLALVESVTRRKRVGLSDLIRSALDAAYPTRLNRQDGAQQIDPFAAPDQPSA